MIPVWNLLPSWNQHLANARRHAAAGRNVDFTTGLPVRRVEQDMQANLPADWLAGLNANECRRAAEQGRSVPVSTAASTVLK